MSESPDPQEGYSIDEMHDALTPVCPDCETEKGIHKAHLGPLDDENHRWATKYELECGHEIDYPGARFSQGVVEMLQADKPEVIQVHD